MRWENRNMILAPLCSSSRPPVGKRGKKRKEKKKKRKKKKKLDVSNAMGISSSYRITNAKEATQKGGKGGKSFGKKKAES